VGGNAPDYQPDQSLKGNITCDLAIIGGVTGNIDGLSFQPTLSRKAGGAAGGQITDLNA